MRQQKVRWVVYRAVLVEELMYKRLDLVGLSISRSLAVFGFGWDNNVMVRQSFSSFFVAFDSIDCVVLNFEIGTFPILWRVRIYVL
jgi:hypothetical protein